MPWSLGLPWSLCLLLVELIGWPCLGLSWSLCVLFVELIGWPCLGLCGFGEQTHTTHTTTKKHIEVGPAAPSGWLGGEGLLGPGLCASLGLFVFGLLN